MRIIIINDHSFVNGGSAQVAIQSAVSLSERGHSVTFFSSVSGDELVQAEYEVISVGQLDILSERNRVKAAVQGVWNTKSARKLKRFLSNEDPANTIIHIHSWSKALSASIFPIVSCMGFKVVLTLHDYFFACPNGGFYNYNSNRVCEKRPMSLACIADNCDSRSYSHKLWRLVRKVVQNRALKLCGGIKHFITVSDFSREIIRPYLPSEANLYRVNNPIAVEKQPRTDVASNNHIVYVGRLAPEKGVLQLASAAQKLGIDVTFVGEGECRDKVKAIYPDAKITGWLSGEEVQEVIKSARALVFPSLLYETQGMAVQESMALGVPVVVSSGIAATQYITDNYNGCVFERGNVPDLTRVLNLLRDDGFVATLGVHAYEDYWSAPSSIDNHIHELEHAYNEILGNNS